MSPTPPGTSSSGRSPEEQYRVVRKRNRVPLSCYPCRTRKKCDRNHPCSNCVKREGANTAACSYATPTTRKKSQAQASSSPDDMQNRIDRLEGLVLSLMQGGASIDGSGSGTSAGPMSGKSTFSNPGTGAKPSPNSGSSVRMGQDDDDDDGDMDGENDDDSDVDESLANSLGVLKVDADKGKSVYIGQEHWHLILADISEVKNYFVNHKKELEKSYETVMMSKPASARDGPVFLSGPKRASEEELRAGLPSKQSVLTLCGRYFNSMDNVVAVVHAPTFQRQLRAHWDDPSKTCLSWLGQLYAMMVIALLSYHKVGDEPPEWKGRSLDVAAEYRLRSVQCLLETDFTRPSQYTVETLVLYCVGEYSSRWDADLGLWLIGSIIVRIAFRMGYHRDPKHFASITPFQAEMRRRTWAIIRMCDVMFSHQVSLPSMIREDDCDTELPSNIFDEEFSPETKIMPTSRPNSEPTPIAYLIAKVKLTILLGKAIQVTTRLGRPLAYEEILELDAKLRDLHRELPPHLKLAPLEGCHDPVTLIMARFNIDTLYQKVMCILHRKFMDRARHNARYAHSRRSVIEAALSTLQSLLVLRQESQPNGRLRTVSWYFRSIATKDFLLPASLVVMDLNKDITAEQQGEQSTCEGGFFWTAEQKADMISKLEAVAEVWKELSTCSVEAFKACRVLEIMLAKIKNPTVPTNDNAAAAAAFAAAATAGGQNGGATNPTDPGLTDMQAEPSAGSNINMMGGMTPNTASILGGSMQTPGSTNFNELFGMDATMQSGGTGMTPNFPTDFDMNNPQSPFSMFTNLEGGGDLMSNFDWNAFENYTQSANWGSVNSFMMAGNAPPPGQTQEDPNQDRTGNFPFGSAN